jgi:triosephosphate isomerase
MKKRIQNIKVPFVVGNWKLTPDTLDLATERIKDYINLAKRYPKVSIAASAPFVFVSEIVKRAKQLVFVGGQDVSQNTEGAFTGDVSAKMLESCGADFSIVGHSERRKAGDTDSVIAIKLKNVVNAQMRAIFCFGESARDDSGEYLNVIKTQIITGVSKLEGKDIEKVVLAYEPVWAIGSKDNDAITPHDLHQMVIFIRKTLRERFSTRVADSVVILYGGSVTPENSEAILFEGEVGGFLVGRASWEKESIEGILKSIHGKKKAVINLKKKGKKVRS